MKSEEVETPLIQQQTDNQPTDNYQQEMRGRDVNVEGKEEEEEEEEAHGAYIDEFRKYVKTIC